MAFTFPPPAFAIFLWSHARAVSAWNEKKRTTPFFSADKLYLSIALGVELAVSLERPIQQKESTGFQDPPGAAHDRLPDDPGRDVENVRGEDQVVLALALGEITSGALDHFPVGRVRGIKLKRLVDMDVVALGKEVVRVGFDTGEQRGVVLGRLEDHAGEFSRKVVDVLAGSGSDFEDWGAQINIQTHKQYDEGLDTC